jgi:hypothetical protein
VSGKIGVGSVVLLNGAHWTVEEVFNAHGHDAAHLVRDAGGQPQRALAVPLDGLAAVDVAVPVKE